MRSAGLWLALAVLGVSAGWCQSAHADDGWRRVGWDGTRMGAVTVSPQSAQEIAVVADGILELSHDGGVVWLPCAVPARVNVMAYDPVQPEWLYAGSDTGLYVSHDRGLSWQRFEAVQTEHKITVALSVDNQYVFASMFDGAGTPVQVFRITRGGDASDTGFPDTNAACFSVDAGRQRLYVGARGGVYWSDDEGHTWQSGGQGAGTFTNRVVVKPGVIWQLSADGLYRSHDGGQSWDRLAGPGDLNGTYYGSGMHVSGLAVSNDAAYYGAWNIGYPYQFLAVYSGGSARSVFDARVNDVATAAGRVWIATDDGLWVNDSLVGTEAAVRRPVIIVPGVLGSLPTTEALKAYASAIVEEGIWDQSYKTPLEIDPVAHTYDGLINFLLARGYQRNKTLFVFPYNWMRDNRDTARDLAQKVRDVRTACSCTQVDIVAHSMGGLIARSYIQSDSYQGDIANLIQLATPNAGAVVDYQVWESGEDKSITVPNHFFNAIVRALMAPATDTEKVVIVRQLMPSVGQLLPVFHYLNGRQYPVGYPRNSFLENLDVPADVSRLKQRVALYVVGGGTKPTLQSLEVGAPHPGALVWPDGPIISSNLGLGDNTVPQSSLEAIDTASLLLDADHGGVVTAAAPFVAQTLMGGYVDDPTPPPQPLSPSHYLLVYARGSVTLQLQTAVGQQINDTTIGIPGAYYSGSGTLPQLMAIPDPKPDNYQINLTGSGTYSVGVIDTASDNDVPNQITGSVTPGEIQHLNYDPDTHTLAAAAQKAGPVIATTTATPPASNFWFGPNTKLIGAINSGSRAPDLPNHSPLFNWHHRHHHARHTLMTRWWWEILALLLIIFIIILVVLQYL